MARRPKDEQQPVTSGSRRVRPVAKPQPDPETVRPRVSTADDLGRPKLKLRVE
jgi:hypothetical protein